MHFDGMVHGALNSATIPRAKIIKIDTSKAEKAAGVIQMFSLQKIFPGRKYTGLIFQDWPLMVNEGEITSYIGDVIAGVVAETEAIARKAVSLIHS